jgi:peptidoglycan biosynthesis protein MviN/MurJ (putative lipid II flippase)
MARASRSPRWYGIPLRVVLITFIGTLLSFAVTLLLAIVGTAIASKLRGVHPDMRLAYRYIAMPIALVAGGMIMVFSISLEVRHYRQMKTLSTIEKMN